MHRPITAAITAAAVALFAAAPIAVADPTPAPPPPAPTMGVQCGGQTVPLDPRVSVEQGLGTLIYLGFRNAMCPPPASGPQ